VALGGAAVPAMFSVLGIKFFHSRPRVINDNALDESAFGTAKYRLKSARHKYKDLDREKGWAGEFVHWRNAEHLHSSIGYPRPNRLHVGRCDKTLAARHYLYVATKAASPRRRSGNTRNWTPICVVTVNPEKPEFIKTKLSNQDQQLIAA